MNRVGPRVGWSSTCSNFGQRIGGEGAFTTQPGDGVHTYFFAVGGQGCGEVVLYDRTGAYAPVYSGRTC